MVAASDCTLSKTPTTLVTESAPLLACEREQQTLSHGSSNQSSREAGFLLARKSAPLFLAGLLQHSFGIVNVYAVGHLGKDELAAVSLALMTANITGIAIYQGMATALDTLCAQGYGSGRKDLVGLYFQRMALLLLALTLPISLLWWNSGSILEHIVPDLKTAELAGTYLRVLILGAPGYALFESGKRFVLAQGIYHATTYILLIAAPFNVLMNWLLVWKLNFGFHGAPLASAITNNILPMMLLFYVWRVDGQSCWNGVSRKAFDGWGEMVSLAIPGMMMLLSEYLAFEVLTLAASHFSTTQLAAQSIISPLVALTFQLPLALGIVSSTQVANQIGAGLASRARQIAQLAFVGACFIGILNLSFIELFGSTFASFLTKDESVIDQVVKVLPIIATFQMFDSIATTLNGIVRGLGKQAIGSLITLLCYYAVALPISFVAGFRLQLELVGLWSGIAVALGLHSLITSLYVYLASWDAAVVAARVRCLEGEV